MLVHEGLAMIADTRTNAGVDNISSYRKLHVFEKPGERVLAVATAGNLSVTQTALAMVAEGVKLPDSSGPETLETAPTLFRAAQILGHAMATVRATINTPASPAADALNVNASMLLGGQIAGGKMGLYLIYGQGNFIECGADTPYLQIGELKYGKPILDRALHVDTPLSEAVKLGLISFDSTIRSNIAVGPPLDLIVRTSGEQRLSNFLLWESAYAELVFQDILWPDYGPEALADAVEAYRRRERRFGGRELASERVTA
jgi:putative proteasome-type protease